MANILRTIKDVSSDAFEGIKDSLTPNIKRIGHVSDAVWDSVRNPVSSFFEPTEDVRIRDVAREIPGTIKEIGQDVARNIASAGVTISRPLGGSESVSASDFPQTFQPAAKFLFRDEPIESIESRVARAELDIQRWGQRQGGRIQRELEKETLGVNHGNALAFAGVFGMVGLDLAPFGGFAKNAAKEAVEQTTKRGALEFLKRMKTSDSVAAMFAGDVVKVKSEAAAEKLLVKIADEMSKDKVVAPPVFQGFEDMTTRVLDRLKGKTTTSKQEIVDFTKMPEMKQVERDLIRRTVDEFGERIPVQEFADRVKTELLPLTVDDPRGISFVPDDAVTAGDFNIHENVVLPSELRGNIADYNEHIYESPIANSAGEIHFGQRPQVPDHYFAHTRVEDLPDEEFLRLTSGANLGKTPDAEGTTRRVIEIQSDLFQKGGLEDLPSLRAADELGSTPSRVDFPEQEAFEAEIDRRRLAGKEALDRAQSELSQLQPYRNTWHERIVREEMKRAAQDGKNKLQFSTGNTIAEVQGWSNAENFFRLADDAPMNTVQPNVGDVLTTVAGRDDNSNLLGIITKVRDNDSVRVANVLTAENDHRVIEEIINPRVERFNLDELALEEITDFTQAELEVLDSVAEGVSFSGKTDFDSLPPELQSTFKFYEKTLGKFLRNKMGAERITDPQGVDWWEVNVPEAAKDDPVQAFGFIGADLLRKAGALTAAGLTGAAIASRAIPGRTRRIENKGVMSQQEFEASASQQFARGQSAGQEPIFIDAELDRIAFAESSGDPNAVSRVGAKGLFQIMPATWQEISDIRRREGIEVHPFSKASDPEISREYARTYLNQRIPEILQSRFPEVPVNKETMLLFYGGGNQWIRDWKRNRLSDAAEIYLRNIGIR